jgi:hypothetical protein
MRHVLGLAGSLKPKAWPHHRSQDCFLSQLRWKGCCREGLKVAGVHNPLCVCWERGGGGAGCTTQAYTSSLPVTAFIQERGENILHILNDMETRGRLGSQWSLCPRATLHIHSLCSSLQAGTHLLSRQTIYTP